MPSPFPRMGPFLEHPAFQHSLHQAPTIPARRRVRYTDPVPAPALSAERAVWVQQALRDRKLAGAP